VLLARLHASVTIPGIRGTIAAPHIAMDDEGADVVHALSDAVKCMFV
jgi:hypothetical protein